MEHHSWSGNLDKDPVTALVTIFPKFPNVVQKAFNYCWKYCLPLLGLVQHVVFWSLAAKTTFSQKLSFRMVASLVSPLVLWGTIIVCAPFEFVSHAILPGIFLYLILVEIVNLPHHLGLPNHRGNLRLPLWEQYSVTRTCLYPKWFAEWIVLNFNYHTEHHLMPEAPWYRLPAIQADLSDALGSSYNGDKSFSWTIKNKTKSLNEIIELNEIPLEKKSAA